MSKPSIRYFLENKLVTVLPAKFVPVGVMPVVGPDDTALARIDYLTAGY